MGKTWKKTRGILKKLSEKQTFFKLFFNIIGIIRSPLHRTPDCRKHTNFKPNFINLIFKNFIIINLIQIYAIATLVNMGRSFTSFQNKWNDSTVGHHSNFLLLLFNVVNSIAPPYESFVFHAANYPQSTILWKY